MGCGCGSSSSLINSITDTKTLQEQIRAMYKADPFHKIKYSTFKEYLQPQKDSKNSNITEPTVNIYDNESIKDLIIKKVKDICTPLEINNVMQSILKDLFILTGRKFNLILPNANKLNEYYDELIMMFFLFNCTEKYEENKKEKKKLIQRLLNLSKENNSDYYITGKLSFIILSIICFCTFTLVYTFLATIMLKIETNDTLTQKEMEELFIYKRDIDGVYCKQVNDIVLGHLNRLKSDINPLAIQQKLLVFCLQPISGIIIENPDVQKIQLTKSEYNKIIDKILQMFNIKNFPALFLE
jgi:hypothetical protein